MSGLTAFADAAIVVVEAAAATFVAWRVSGSVVETEGSSTLRIVTGLVVGMTQIIGVQMLCAALDVLYVPVVFALHIALALVAWRGLRPVERPGRPRHPAGWLGAALWAVLAFAGLLGVLMSVRTPSDPDSVQYHIPNAASWLQVHNLWHLPATNPGYFTNGYPSDGELITSWLLQPLHQAQWAAFPSLLYGLAILAGAALLSEELGGSPRNGLLAATAILLTPLSWASQIGSAETDWISISGLVMAVALVLHCRSRPDRRWLLLAGLALGIAMGSKDTALLPGLFVIGLAAVILPRSQRLRGCVLMVIGVAALAGVWFVRDGIQAGNPLYPEPIRIAGRTLFSGAVGPVTAWSPSITKDALTGHGFALKIWVESLAVWVGPAIVVCAGAALSVARLKRQSIRPLLAAIAGVWFLIYLATPYTGPSVFPLLITAQVRYGFSAMILAALCACIESPWWRIVAWIAVGYDLWAVLHGVHLASVPDARIRTPGESLVLGALAGALVVAVVLATSQLGRLRSIVASAPQIAIGSAAIAIGAAACGALAVVAVQHAPVRSRLDVALAVAGRPYGVVMIDGDSDVLGAMGDKLQHRVVSAGGGGAPHQVPLSTPALLDARVRSVDPVAVIVGPPNWPGVVPGWKPPGYRLLYSESGRRVYIDDTDYAESSRGTHP